MPRRGENIYRRKDGLYEARYVKGIDAFGKKKYGSVYAHSYREVKEKRLDIVSKISILPQSASARRMLLNDLINEWLYVNKNRLKQSTYEKYHATYKNHIEKELGSYPIIYLTPIIIQQYIERKQEGGLSKATTNGILTFIKNCLKYAQRQYGTPVVEMIYSKETHKTMRVLSTKEQNALVAFLLTETDVYKFGVLLALYTGMRIGELCALLWGDIKDGTITINKTMQRLSRGKGNGTTLIVDEPKTPTSNRIIPIPSFLMPIIEQFRQTDTEYVLCTDNNGFTEPRALQYRFSKYIKTLGLPKANFHSLRHTFATRSIERGFDVKSLSAVLGHSNVSTTLNRYVHSSLALKTANMEKLSLFV